MGGPRTLCIDIGGTGIKTMVVDVSGKPLTERLRVDTPRPATPRAVIKAILGMAGQQGAFDRISVGFPGSFRGVLDRPQPHRPGSGQSRPPLTGARQARAGQRPDVRPGRVKGRASSRGTLGTNWLSLFVEGRLVPNVQLAHHAGWRGKTYEEELGKAALKKAGKKKWNKRVRKAIRSLSELFNYDRLYIGGGNAGKIAFDLPSRVKVVSNVEGLLGGVALWNGKENSYGVR
jgi:polyphosphate glucokinase